MKQITVRVNNDLVGELDRVAERMGRTRAAVVRVAIDRFVEDAWAADDTLSNDRREEVPRNPYARTRPTPLEDRERNLHERTVRRARERQRDLLARLEGRHLEAEPVGCEPTEPGPGEAEPVECEPAGSEPAGSEPPGLAPEGNRTRRAPRGSKRRILEAFGPVEEPESLEEFRAWLRAPCPETPECEDDQEW